MEAIHCSVCGHVFCKHEDLKRYKLSWNCAKCGGVNTYTDTLNLHLGQASKVYCDACEKYLGKIRRDEGNIIIKCQYCKHCNNIILDD